MSCPIYRIPTFSEASALEVFAHGPHRGMMKLDYSFYSVTLVGFFAGISSGLFVKLYKAMIMGWSEKSLAFT